MPDGEDEGAVRELNGLFYAAHEGRDFPMMESLWSHGADTVCIHPGWPILRGWEAIAESWKRIFSGPSDNQFIVTNDQLNMAHGVAWMTHDENLMSAGGTGTIAATNIFLKIGSRWKIVHHHGSPVASLQRNV